jgi:hypothetical protein
MAENDRTEPADLEGRGQRQPGKQIDLIVAQLLGGPRRDPVRKRGPLPPAVLDKLPVGVAADPDRALSYA